MGEGVDWRASRKGWVSGSFWKNRGYSKMERVVRRRRVEVRDHVEKKEVIAASRSDIGVGEGEMAVRGIDLAERERVAVDILER
jgi:hypothetical protein